LKDLKTVKIDAATGKAESVDDGQPAPAEPVTPKEEVKIDLEDLNKLVKYAKSKSWIT